MKSWWRCSFTGNKSWEVYHLYSHTDLYLNNIYIWNSERNRNISDSFVLLADELVRSNTLSQQCWLYLTRRQLNWINNLAHTVVSRGGTKYQYGSISSSFLVQSAKYWYFNLENLGSLKSFPCQLDTPASWLYGSLRWHLSHEWGKLEHKLTSWSLQLADGNLKKVMLRDARSAFKSKVWTHIGFYNIDGTKRFNKRPHNMQELSGKIKYMGNTTNMPSYLQHHPTSLNQIMSMLISHSWMRACIFEDNNSVYIILSLHKWSW